MVSPVVFLIMSRSAWCPVRTQAQRTYKNA